MADAISPADDDTGPPPSKRPRLAVSLEEPHQEPLTAAQLSDIDEAVSAHDGTTAAPAASGDQIGRNSLTSALPTAAAAAPKTYLAMLEWLSQETCAAYLTPLGYRELTYEEAPKDRAHCVDLLILDGNFSNDERFYTFPAKLKGRINSRTLNNKVLYI
jgi:hypothetical protein